MRELTEGTVEEMRIALLDPHLFHLNASLMMEQLAFELFLAKWPFDPAVCFKGPAILADLVAYARVDPRFRRVGFYRDERMATVFASPFDEAIKCVARLGAEVKYRGRFQQIYAVAAFLGMPPLDVDKLAQQEFTDLRGLGEVFRRRNLAAEGLKYRTESVFMDGYGRRDIPAMRV